MGSRFHILLVEQVCYIVLFWSLLHIAHRCLILHLSIYRQYINILFLLADNVKTEGFARESCRSMVALMDVSFSFLHWTHYLFLICNGLEQIPDFNPCVNAFRLAWGAVYCWQTGIWTIQEYALWILGPSWDSWPKNSLSISPSIPTVIIFPFSLTPPVVISPRFFVRWLLFFCEPGESLRLIFSERIMTRPETITTGLANYVRI